MRVIAKPGAIERLAALRVETLEEIRLYELGHGEAISQVDLEALGARLELVAVFDDDARRVPVHPPRQTGRSALLLTRDPVADAARSSRCRRISPWMRYGATATGHQAFARAERRGRTRDFG